VDRLVSHLVGLFQAAYGARSTGLSPGAAGVKDACISLDTVALRALQLRQTDALPTRQ
jgi:hypothetical protein